MYNIWVHIATLKALKLQQSEWQFRHKLISHRDCRKEKKLLPKNSIHHLMRYLSISFCITIFISVEAYQLISFDGIFQTFKILKDPREIRSHKVTIIFILNNRFESFFPSCFSHIQLTAQHPRWDTSVENNMESKCMSEEYLDQTWSM